MSLRKGDNVKKGQKYQNSTTFRAERYGQSRQVKLAGALPLVGVCSRCKEKLEWKKKYDKYKPLTVPKKCVSCSEKRVRQAYYRLCQECAETSHVCAKCGGKEVVDGFPMSSSEQAREEAEFRRGLKMLNERERRTLLRDMSQGFKKGTGSEWMENRMENDGGDGSGGCDGKEDDSARDRGSRDGEGTSEQTCS